MGLGVSAGPVAADKPGEPVVEADPATQTVPLHNVEAPTEGGSNCPNGVDDFWHFIVNPGNGFDVVSITLNVGGQSYTFSGDQIIDNHNANNVFVTVPDGLSPYDLVQAGSSAVISPGSPDAKFILSHYCDGSGTTPYPTTTTTLPPATTTTTTLPPATTTTTTLPPATTTTTTLPPATTTTTTTTLPSIDLTIEPICYELDVDGEVVKYWFRLTNPTDTAVVATWPGGVAQLPAGGSQLISSTTTPIQVTVNGQPAASAIAPPDMCTQNVTFTKQVEGPGADGADYTIQISRLVGSAYVPEGEPFVLNAGETIEIPLPSTFNAEGINYKVTEVVDGGAAAHSITPDSFVAEGHLGETISVVITNHFASISLDKTVSASQVAAGDSLQYTLVATNTGAVALDPIVIEDRLPDRVTYVSAAVAGNAGTCSLVDATRPQLVRCTLAGPFAPDATTPPIVLTVTVDSVLLTTDTLLNQAKAIGRFEPGTPSSSPAGSLSCYPVAGEVCDLSAQIGTSIVQSQSLPPTPADPIVPPAPVGAAPSPAPRLPSTGSSGGRLVAVGAFLLVAGGVLVASSRRRTLEV